ncbi:MarR family transcriptional regulator [Actinobacillus minor 202]|uniref:MarR family transcriptional regulator n=1 Tax=Actinobacillus minor 202 TaxID=591023 RepID=A0ABM9YUZ8_9PAST|nr:MarR family winged helix-turn-helix transcriptional regulator [Actinobacillus minor]EEV25168.1 MarR family transcriptional regulator [Actinobacillus minor 202]
MHLMDKLGQSIVHINRLYEQWTKQQGISNSNLLWVYHSLIHHQNRTQQEICDEFDIAKQTLSPLCKELVAQGILEISPICTDKREKRWQLTEKGRLAATPIIERLRQFEQQAFDTLGEQESEKLLVLAQQFGEILERQLQGKS